MPVIIPCLEKNPFIILYSKGIPFIVPYIERIPFLIPHLERILFIIPYLEKNQRGLLNSWEIASFKRPVKSYRLLHFKGNILKIIPRVAY